MKFYARLQNKMLKFDNIDYLKGFLNGIKDNQLLSVEIEKRQRARTNDQNAMYWGYVLAEISKETGHTAEDLHEIFKRKFLPRRFIKINGRRLLAPPTTTRENTVEFTEYIEKIKAFGATELGIEWQD